MISTRSSCERSAFAANRAPLGPRAFRFAIACSAARAGFGPSPIRFRRNLAQTHSGPATRRTRPDPARTHSTHGSGLLQRGQTHPPPLPNIRWWSRLHSLSKQLWRAGLAESNDHTREWRNSRQWLTNSATPSLWERHGHPTDSRTECRLSRSCERHQPDGWPSTLAELRRGRFRAWL